MHLTSDLYRFLAVVLAVVIVASACGGKAASSPLDPDESGHSADQGGLTTTTTSGVDPELLQLMRDSAQPVPVAQARFDEVEAFYDRYLQLRANSIDRTDPIEVIDAVTTQAGRAEVVTAMDYNDSLHADERLSAVDALYLYSNVVTIVQADDDTILVADCTEQHEVNVLDQHLVFWQTNEIRIDTSSGEMRVDSFTTTHNGYLEVDTPIGCAPISFQERAEATAAQVWGELSAWGQNIDARRDGSLSERIGDPLRGLVLDAAVAASTESFTFEAHVENSEFSATGINTQARLGAIGPEAIIVQVESCHQFPNGRAGYDIVTQAPVQDLRPGAQQMLRFHVLIDADAGEERLDQVVAIEFVADWCSL